MNYLNQLSEHNYSDFVLTFDREKSHSNYNIFVNSKEEFHIYFLLLGNNFMIDFESLPKSILKELNNSNYREIRNSINKSLLNNKLILKCAEKINLTNFINFHFAKNVPKEMTHKKNLKNVLIDKWMKFSQSGIYCFRANLKSTPEINLDHVHYGHVEPIIISEACRQAAMFTALDNNVNRNNQKFFISEDFKHYYKLINRNDPVIISVYEIDKGIKLGVNFFTVFQNKELCSSGYFVRHKKVI